MPGTSSREFRKGDEGAGGARGVGGWAVRPEVPEGARAAGAGRGLSVAKLAYGEPAGSPRGLVRNARRLSISSYSG